jgi:cell division septation protein DedD
VNTTPPAVAQSNRARTMRWVALAGVVVMLTVLVGVGLIASPPEANAAEAPVGLGTAESYSVLGGQAVTNTGPSTLSGDLGVSPGTAITGFPPGTVGGATHAGDAAAAQAQSDLVVAYDDAAGRAPTANIAGDLVDLTLPGGVYKSSGPIGLSGTLTLDGENDPSSVFIFQIASTLITASSSHINLINGAQPCHVYWQVGSSATLGTTSSFIGTIMALTSISVTTGTTVDGRALARNGQVSLDNNVFTNSPCDNTPPTTTTTTTAPTTTTTTTAPTTTTTAPTTTTTAPTTTTTAPTTTTTAPTTTTTGGATTTTTGGATTTTGGGSTTTGTTTGHATTTSATVPGGGSGGGGGGGHAGTGGGTKPNGSPSGGTSKLAFTGAAPWLAPVFGGGVLLLAAGVLLFVFAHSRARSRRQ